MMPCSLPHRRRCSWYVADSSFTTSGPTHTMKGSAVVAIGVDRRNVGRDDDAR
jgi:hypothetical protein